MNTGLTIGTLARECGVGVETIRYYQRRGLLPTPRRGDGIRRYGAPDLRRLRFIRTAQAAGFTLEQVAELLALGCDRRPGEGPHPCPDTHCRPGRQDRGTASRPRCLETPGAGMRQLDRAMPDHCGIRSRLTRVDWRCGAGLAKRRLML